MELHLNWIFFGFMHPSSLTACDEQDNPTVDTNGHE